MRLKLMLVIAVLGLAWHANGQNEFFISANANLYVPVNSAKGTFPIIGYDKESTPKLLIGGFGVGACAWRSIEEKVSAKVAIGFARHTYWDEAIEYKDPSNQPLGSYVSRTNDYVFGLHGTANYFLNKSWYAGAGLGLQVMIVSLTRNPAGLYAEVETIRNRNNKTVIPVLPLEFGLKRPKTFYALRYEHTLVSKYAKDLGSDIREGFGIVSFELGVSIK